MMWKIPLFKIFFDDEDIKNVTEVLSRGSYWATGPEIRQFEEKISEYVGAEYAVAFNSGTSGLHALLMAYNIKRGDEIIVPSFTFIATANAPLFVGAKPVFSEIEDKTYGLDPEDVKERITSKTKAIMPIHYGGCPCFIRELKEIAQDHDILLIEDAAESLGSEINHKKIGTFGDASMFSFCQNKVISTGEGGAITTDSKAIYDRLKLLASHGRLEEEDYFSSTESGDYVTLGYNFRMPSMIASLGLSQIKKIDKIIQMRRDKARYLDKYLSKIKGIYLPSFPQDRFNVYQMYTILINGNKRNELMKYLSNQGIMTKVYFPPIHLSSFYRNTFGYTKGLLPLTEDISSQVLSLPIYPAITENEMEYIVEKIRNFFEEK